MISIPATSYALSPVGVAASQARPAGAPVAALQHSAVSPEITAAPATREEHTTVPEAGDGSPDAGLGTPLMVQYPTWRALPPLGSLSGDLVLTGHPLPKGGKALPPRMPTFPVVMPSPDVRGPGAGGSQGLPVAIAAAASPVDGSEFATAPRVIQSDAASPAVTAAPARMPREIVGRMPGATAALSVPLPGADAPEAAVDSPPSSPQIAAGLPSWMLRARPAPASVQTPSGTPGLATGLAPAAEVSATAALLERAAAVETGAAGAQATRASIAPDAAILSAATSAQPVQPGSPAVATAQQHLPEMVGSEEWAEAVAQRLTQLADSPNARASIRLNPPQLGPMQVEVHVDGDRAIIQLAVHHDATRDALDQATPRLRAQLEDSGFTRVDVSVSHNPHRERPGSGDAYAEASSFPDDDLPNVASGANPASSSRLLDAYA